MMKSKEEHRAYQAKWKRDNPEKYLKSRRRYEKKNRKRIRKVHAIWAKKHPEKIREYEARRKLRRQGAPLREINLLRSYGITAADYNKLLRSQKGRCAICRKRETSKGKLGKPRSLGIDHCHKTDKIRGLLCSRCNIGVGHLLDSPRLLRAAATYLENKSNWTLTVKGLRSYRGKKS
jgi:hypothetical protein